MTMSISWAPSAIELAAAIALMFAGSQPSSPQQPEPAMVEVPLTPATSMGTKQRGPMTE